MGAHGKVGGDEREKRRERGAYQKARNDRLIAAGMCTVCAKRPIDRAVSKRFCGLCGMKARARQRDRRAEFRRKGRCIQCGGRISKPRREIGFATCGTCKGQSGKWA